MVTVTVTNQYGGACIVLQTDSCLSYVLQRERRIVYVGGIPNNYTRHQMRGAFSRFGEIELVQLHFREHG